jgi:hypothetical protein
MAGNTPETLITFHDLHIGAADTGHKHTDKRLVLAGLRPAGIRLESERAVKEKGLHGRVYVTIPSFHHATKKGRRKSPRPGRPDQEEIALTSGGKSATGSDREARSILDIVGQMQKEWLDSTPSMTKKDALQGIFDRKNVTGDLWI